MARNIQLDMDGIERVRKSGIVFGDEISQEIKKGTDALVELSEQTGARLLINGANGCAEAGNNLSKRALAIAEGAAKVAKDYAKAYEGLN